MTPQLERRIRVHFGGEAATAKAITATTQLQQQRPRKRREVFTGMRESNTAKVCKAVQALKNRDVEAETGSKEKSLTKSKATRP
jgi:hypothetical protein